MGPNMAHVGEDRARPVDDRRIGRHASMRELADALGMSHQRVHQIIDLSTGKGALKQSRAQAPCSFCGREGADMPQVVAGPGVFICDRCIDLASAGLVDGPAASDERSKLVRLGDDDARARCGFCGRRQAQAGGMLEAPTRPQAGKLRTRRPGVRICAACVRLCQEILAEELSRA